MEAIDRFSPERGVKFETYALSRIKGAMLDGLRAYDWVPVSARQRAKELEGAFARVEARLGRSATDQEVAEELGLTPSQMGERLKEVAATAVISLEDLLGSAGEGSALKHRFLAASDGAGADPVAQAEYQELKRILAQAVAGLPYKERLVVSLYYHEGLTAKEIARVMGLSQSRISQLHSKAILRLRGKLAKSRGELM